MRIGNHLGTRFGVWNGRHAWFWFVADARCNGAAVGAAANEADAICEARCSIEEMATLRPGTAQSRPSIKTAVNRGRAGAPADAVRQTLIQTDCLETEG
jgi:hypothetical protein